MEIMHKVVKLLDDNNIEQKDLCTFLNVKPQTFSDWKAGRNKSYMKHITQIANYFNVSVDYLTGETDIKEKTPTVTDERITPSEYRLVLAYRAKPEMQEAVNKLLGIVEKAKPSPYASIAAYGDGEIQIGKKKPKITD